MGMLLLGIPRIELPAPLDPRVLSALLARPGLLARRGPLVRLVLPDLLRPREVGQPCLFMRGFLNEWFAIRWLSVTIPDASSRSL